MFSITSFGDLSTHFHALARAGRYPEARDLLETHAARFPDEHWHIYEWRIAIHALCGQADQMLQVFNEAVAAGYWYPEYRFRDADYAAFQGQPAFEALVATCEARYQAAQAASHPTCFTYPSEPGRQHLWVFHRNHFSVARELPRWEWLQSAGWTLFMPQSSRLMGPETHIWDDRQQAMEEASAHYAAYPPAEETLWAGYMSGADVALRLAFQPEVSAQGFIAISPYIPDANLYAPLAEAKPHLRGYIFIGGEDIRCRPGALALAETLRKAGLRVLLDDVPSFTFGTPPDFRQRITQALAFIQQGG